MSYRVYLDGSYSRAKAKRLIDDAPQGFVMEIREPRRSLDQNDYMWSLLTDISEQCPLGRKHTPDDWKAIAMNACGWECQFCEGLDGRPFPMGFRSSKMTKAQMSALIDWLLAFGAEHGIQWTKEAA